MPESSKIDKSKKGKVKAGRSPFEFAAILFIILGIFVIGYAFFLGTSNNISFSGGSGNILDFSEFIGGLIGSFWSLAGVLLFYASLASQRRDLEAQQDLLVKQINEVVNQTEEFKIQNQINKEQQDEETFFQLLRFHNEIISSISIDSKEVDFATGEKVSKIINGRKSFVEYYDIFKRFFQDYSSTNPDKSLDVTFDACYNNFFLEYQADLGHYFRNLESILTFIDTLPTSAKKFFLELLLAQLSNYELTLLFFHCLRKSNTEFKALVVKYEILAQVPKDEVTTMAYTLYDLKAFGDDGFGSGDVLGDEDTSFDESLSINDDGDNSPKQSVFGSVDEIMSRLKSITDTDQTPEIKPDEEVEYEDFDNSFFDMDDSFEEEETVNEELIDTSFNEEEEVLGVDNKELNIPADEDFDIDADDFFDGEDEFDSEADEFERIKEKLDEGLSLTDQSLFDKDSDIPIEKRRMERPDDFFDKESTEIDELKFNDLKSKLDDGMLSKTGSGVQSPVGFDERIESDETNMIDFESIKKEVEDQENQNKPKKRITVKKKGNNSDNQGSGFLSKL